MDLPAIFANSHGQFKCSCVHWPCYVTEIFFSMLMSTTSGSYALSVPCSVIITVPWGREGMVGCNLYFPFRAEHSMMSNFLHHPQAASCGFMY